MLATIGWVAAVATASLVLAAAGRHEAAPWAAAVALAGALVSGGKALRGAARDRAGALIVLAAVGVGGVLYVPGFPYGSSDRDPGVYTYTAYAIARTGSTYVPDPLADRPASLHATVDGQRVPGLHPTGRTALPGFFLAAPALEATAYRTFGETGRRLVNPFVGMLAVAAFGLLVRRLAGVRAGLLTVALLAGTMPQVWQAKTPGPEMLAQAGVAGALLAAAAGVRRGSGVLTTFVWVARPDGLLAFLLGLFVGRDRRYRTGLLAAAPIALWQTYALAGDYAARNGIPPWPVLVGLVMVAGVGSRIVPGAAPLARRLAAPLAFLFVGALLVRQGLAHQPPPLRPGAAPGGYEPFTIGRIAGLVTWPALVLALVGVKRAAHWAPLLLAPAVLAAPYLVAPRISPDLMFWGRRFVPMLLPAVAMLAAMGATRLRGRILTTVAVSVAIVVPYAQSWPLRTHEEYGGGQAAAQAAAAASHGQQAVYIWVRERENCCDQPAYLLAGAVWLRYGKASMTVWPEEVTQQAEAAATLGLPILLVAPGITPPAGTVTYVAHHRTTITVWERGGLTRPSKAVEKPLEFTVWRYVPTPR